VANIKAMVSAQFFDGLPIGRVQDNYVTQWGDIDEVRKDEAATRKLPDETVIAWSKALPIVKLPDADGYAPETGWLDQFPYQWRFRDHEVAYLLEVPLAHLRDPKNLIPDRRVINGREYEFQSYQFGDDLIWGATARMLGNFLDVLQAL
jgi:hypothetical protein